MKNPLALVALLIVTLLGTLVAQTPAAPTPTPVLSPGQLLLKELAAAKTPEEVYAIEAKTAATPGVAQVSLADPIFDRLIALKVPFDQAAGVLFRNIPNWETSTSPSVLGYYTALSNRALSALKKDLAAAKTPADVDAALTELFAHVPVAGRYNPVGHLHGYTTINLLTDATVRVNHPEALQWAVAAYRVAPFTQGALNLAVGQVARALRLKDGNLVRANAFITSQTKGGDLVLTAEEVAPTTPYVKAPERKSVVSGDIDPAIARSLDLIKLATTSETLTDAVTGVATWVKAKDLNLVRANEWIKAQKEGKAYPLN